MSQNFNVRLPNELVNKLESYAEKERRSRNEVIRIILEDFFNERLVPVGNK